MVPLVLRRPTLLPVSRFDYPPSGCADVRQALTAPLIAGSDQQSPWILRRGGQARRVGAETVIVVRHVAEQGVLIQILAVPRGGIVASRVPEDDAHVGGGTGDASTFRAERDDALFGYPAAVRVSLTGYCDAFPDRCVVATPSDRNRGGRRAVSGEAREDENRRCGQRHCGTEHLQCLPGVVLS